MTTKPITQKMEDFCRAFAESGNATKAYYSSHDVGENTKRLTVSQMAYELLKDQRIKNRVEEIRAELRELWKVSTESIIAELDEAREHALKDPKGAAAAVSATNSKAKIAGLVVDRHEHSGPDGKPIEHTKTVSLGDLSDDELAVLKKALGV